ncbi:MAG: type I methionyl aminopeptidase [Chrysiogenales bacterium]|nr:MAG: type I methionyl aminopeptidase [Chrysiogenales bacterium]
MKAGIVRLKTSDDIKRIRDAGAIASEIFRGLTRMSLAGLSTWELDSMIELMILRLKGRPAFKTVLRYSSSSCISLNDEVVHGVPSKKRKIHSGDLVKIDIGVVFNGYFCDACHTFGIGKVPENARLLADTAMRCLQLAVEVMTPGNRIGDIGHTIQTHAETHGYSVVHDFTGHGVGFALHEPPKVPHYGRKGTGPVLEPGMVLAVEPMINEGGHAVRILDDGWTAVTADGSLSAHYEHTIAITGEGPLVLTI